jgi:hypothetical protein
MMLRVDNRYLDFTGEVDIERQVKLFEELDKTRGDFSYEFYIPDTHNNLSILGLPFPDNSSKRVYNNINCDIINESGEELYSGFLRIESIRKGQIRCRFFSGNSNWMNLLTGDMTELDLSAYDQELTDTNIRARVSAADGIVFPLIDTGGLVSRSFRNLKAEDFVGCFYLKTLMKEVFQQSGLKITGELLNDPLFNQIVIATNTRSKVEVARHSIYVGKNGTQMIPASDDALLEFNLQTTPYFIGDAITFSSDTTYEVPVDMIVDIQGSWESVDEVLAVIDYGGITDTITKGGAGGVLSVENVFVPAGEVIRMSIINLSVVDVPITGATLKITPKFIYKAFGGSSVPLWSKLDFVKNIFGIFNCITDYDPFSKTVTLNLFEKLKDKTPIDLSEYLEVEDTDYSEFISNYGRNTSLSYTEGNDEDLREYNIATFNKYGQGIIEVDNDFIPESGEILESDFSTPISYINPIFDCSLEKISYIEMEDGKEIDITEVTDFSGSPVFHTSTNILRFLKVGDLVRIDTSEITYNGIYRVDSLTNETPSVSWVFTVQGLTYEDDATGEATRLTHNLTTDDNVYLLINSGQRDIEDFSKTQEDFYLEDTAYDTWSLGFFNLVANDTQFNSDYRQSLSFGPITDPLFYQRTLIETYWRGVANILNDPVMLKARGYIPDDVFRRLTPLTPVYLKTKETVNTYYINRIKGYRPCEVELIKLP